MHQASPIRAVASAYMIEPTHNGGSRGDAKGFMPITESLVTVARDASPTDIGAALIQGFDLCTSVFAGS